MKDCALGLGDVSQEARNPTPSNNTNIELGAIFRYRIPCVFISISAKKYYNN